MEPHVEIMVSELAELEGRIARLEKFIDSNPIYKTLEKEEQKDMFAQCLAMAQYAKFLKRRVERATKQ